SSPPLLNRHLYLPVAHDDYKKQHSFDKRLAQLIGFSSTEETQMTRAEFEARLSNANKVIKGTAICNKN
ncbi:MAG: hypothetical protein ACRC7P_06005, partial [Enterovibrio sp.]